MLFKIGLIFVAFFVGIFATPTIEGQALDVNSVVSNRIVGGSVAANGSAPYVVAISTGWIFRSLVCGGSLITERYVLTAAHCVEALYTFGFLSRSLRVTVGTNQWNRGGDTYRVERNVTHQQYQPSVIKNDVGLLVTKTKVQLSQNVAPVPLSFDFVGAGVAAKATGWGRTRFMGPISNILLELEVKTIDGKQCVNEIVNASAQFGVELPPVDPEIELCTFHSAGHGMCNGDSGSALVRVDNTQQIGVVSWGLPCARGAPDMFLRISAYKDWLLQNVKE